MALNIIEKCKHHVARLASFFRFRNDFDQFRRLSVANGRNFEMTWNNRVPCLNENSSETLYDRHYIYHTAWAARILSQNIPQSHIDISSSLYFSTMVSAFIPIHFYDFRPAHVILNGFTSAKADLFSLPFADNSIDSLSCMHVVEHVGLGRYGDPLDPDGDIKAISQLKRVLSLGGNLLFVVPIGKPKIMFNAHRIYSYEQILSYFEDFALKEFALIPDDDNKEGIIRNASKAVADLQIYGCGCFWFSKTRS